MRYAAQWQICSMWRENGMEQQQIIYIFFLWRCDTTRNMASSFLRFFLDHTQRSTIVGRTPLDEWSARRRDLYLTTHNTHNRQISTPPVGFEPKISACERTQTYALDHAATGTGKLYTYRNVCREFPYFWSAILKDLSVSKKFFIRQKSRVLYLSVTLDSNTFN